MCLFVLAIVMVTIPADKSTASEIVFIDSSIEDLGTLVGSVDPNSEIILLDKYRDGIEQIADVLSNRRNVDAIHILSHGRQGELQLGITRLTLASMNYQHADDLAVIARSLSENADILIYGCEFAQGAVGHAAIDRLSTLTKADVIASTDVTGHTNYGGNWLLELATGPIEAAVAILVQSQDEWIGVLPTANLTSDEDSYIKLKDPDDNFGSDVEMFVDRETTDLHRALVQFDLSSIPAGATITSATLTIEAIGVGGDMSVGAYQLLESWSESTVTWNERSTGVNWSTAGSNFNSTAEDLLDVTSDDDGPHDFDLTSLVQDWVDGSASNYGVMVGSPDGGGNRQIEYMTRENTTAPVLVVTYTVPEPEIDVSGLGVSIADGDATPTGVDDTDFGSLYIATGSNANIFSITNSGSGLLNLTGTPRVTIGGVDAADFTLTTDAATSVAAGGGSTTFTITFDPSAVGLRTATVSIANDDADEDPYNFTIQGTGAVPEMTVSKSPDVANVNSAGDDISYTITLTNTGVITITGIAVTDPLLPSISCTPGSGPNPSDMAPAAVTTCTGTYTVTQADFDTNGGGDGDIDNIVTVTGTGGLSETASAAVTLNTNSDLAIIKTANDTTQVVVGQVITYTYAVTNNGNQTITNVFLNDTQNGSGPTPIPTNETLTTDNLPLSDSTDGGTDGTWDTIAPGDIVTFTATYTVTQSDVDTLQ